MPASTLAQRVAAAIVLLSLAFVASPTFASLVIGPSGTAFQSFTSVSSTTQFANLNMGGWKLFVGGGSPTWEGGDSNPSLTTSGSASAGNHVFTNGGTERALGFIVGNANARNIMVEIKNDTGGVIDSVAAAWNLEKYRNGNSPLSISFFHSSDGVNWLSGATDNVLYAADGNTDALASPTSLAKNAIFSGLNLPNGSLYYLRWQFTRTSEDNNTAAVGLDDVVLTSVASVPETSAFVATGAAGLVSWLALKRRPTGASGAKRRAES
jgi:hypothetical protein